MSEAFIHYVWQFQYFAKTDLLTTSGEVIHIFETGNRNDHAGPDFQNARIKIGEMMWVGSVEIHIHASGWIEHRHDADEAYENVILHVVWKDDKPVRRTDGSLLPTIELRNRVDEGLLLKYRKLVQSTDEIPCAASFPQIPEIIRLSMLDRALAERLEVKAKAVMKLLERNRNDWEETCYQLLAKNFGFKVNADPFLQLAQALPYRIVSKHLDKLIQIEALMFGQAGFLEDHDIVDEYTQILYREYTVLRQKYQFGERRLNKTQWKFLRLRPANFPSTRLAQFSSLLHGQKNIFSRISEIESFHDLGQLIYAEQPEYWKHHYQLGKPSKEIVPLLGRDSINNVVINTIVPVLVAYGRSKDDQAYVDRALTILQNLPAESNKITRRWAALGLKVKTGFDSQALLELNNNFCSKRRCLDCNIGAFLVKPMR